MKGQILKSFLVSRNLKQSDIAKSLGVTHQAFNSLLQADDVKSSLIERLSVATGVKISEIYGESKGDNYAQAIGTGNTAVAGTNVSLNSQIDVLTAQLKEKDAQINKLLDLLRNGR